MKNICVTTSAVCPSNKPKVLQVKGLSGGPQAMALFKQIDFCLPAGVSALLGDEDVGKTSLLRLLAGDLAPLQGQVLVHGRRVALPKAQPSLVFWCDLRLPLHDNDTPEACWACMRQHLPAWSSDTQNALITDLRLTPHLGKRLNMLSTGSRRKVGLIAALASGASVTLIDQAFVSLDQGAKRVIEQMLCDASRHSQRAWLMADYEVPSQVPLSSVLTLSEVPL